MRSNGRRAGEWPDEEYHRRKAKSEAERNGLPYVSLADISRGKEELGQNAPRKPGNGGRMRESDFSLGDKGPEQEGHQRGFWGDFV